MGQFIDYGNFDFIFLVFLYLSDCFKKNAPKLQHKKTGCRNLLQQPVFLSSVADEPSAFQFYCTITLKVICLPSTTAVPVY
jgi:hypothetical protein